MYFYHKISSIILLLTLFTSCFQEESSPLPITDKIESSQDSVKNSEVKDPIKINTHSLEVSKEINQSEAISTKSTLEDFYGKPSVIVFGGTYCSHCRKAIPEFKKQVWNIYKDKANLWVNVIDGKKFNVEEIAQGYNKNLQYENITQRQCDYVPSFVILDSKGQLTLSSCGGEKSIEDIAETLNTLL